MNVWMHFAKLFWTFLSLSLLFSVPPPFCSFNCRSPGMIFDVSPSRTSLIRLRQHAEMVVKSAALVSIQRISNANGQNVNASFVASHRWANVFGPVWCLLPGACFQCAFSSQKTALCLKGTARLSYSLASPSICFHSASLASACRTHANLSWVPLSTVFPPLPRTPRPSGHFWLCPILPPPVIVRPSALLVISEEVLCLLYASRQKLHQKHNIKCISKAAIRSSPAPVSSSWARFMRAQERFEGCFSLRYSGFSIINPVKCKLWNNWHMWTHLESLLILLNKQNHFRIRFSIYGFQFGS